MFGVGAFFCIPPLEGRPSDVSWVCLPRNAFLKASADPRGWAHYSFGWLFVWNYSEILDSSPPSLHHLCSHHAAGKPNRLCTVNLIISLLSTWWTENSSLNCWIACQDPSPSVSLVCFYLLPRILSTPARILFYFLRLSQFKMPDFFLKAADLWRFIFCNIVRGLPPLCCKHPRRLTAAVILVDTCGDALVPPAFMPLTESKHPIYTGHADNAPWERQRENFWLV